MKSNNSYRIRRVLLAMLGTALTTACTSDFTEWNTNPNEATEDMLDWDNARTGSYFLQMEQNVLVVAQPAASIGTDRYQTVEIMGGDGFGSVKNYASAEDLEGSVYCSGYAPGTDSVKQFEEDYKAAYNVDEIPNMFAPLAYDAAMLLCEGLKAAEEQGLTAGTDEYKQAVIDAIKNMNGTEGITGSYSFDEYNNPIKPVAIIELTGGDEVYQEMY